MAVRLLCKRSIPLEQFVPDRAPLRIFYGRIVVTQAAIGGTEYPIRDALQPGVPAEHYGHVWVIGNLEVHEDLRLVTARLGYFPEDEPDTETDYDREMLSFVDRAVARPKSISAAFALDYERGA